MKKRMWTLVLAVALVTVLAVGLVFGLAACNPTDAAYVNADYSNIKIGFIMLHDPATSTYDANFYNAMEEVRRGLGLREDQVLYRHSVAEENSECYNAAIEMAEEGCNIIFADSFGHEGDMIKAAREKKNVQFLHATGTQAHVVNLPNYHNAFASIYEGRYVAGVAAGRKLKEMGYGKGGSKGINNPKVGYVGAFRYAEVVSGFTSWFLGVRSVIPEVTMDVQFTNSWFDIDLEKAAAENLINNRHCVLISQHADSYGAPQACEQAGVPNVSYNGSTESTGPNTFIISSRIDWAPYLKYAINCVKNGSKIATDWTGTIATGSVQLTALGNGVFGDKKAEVQAQLDAVIDQLNAGTLKIFSEENLKDAYFLTGSDDNPTKVTDLTQYKADVDGDYVGEAVVISDGYYHESEYRSAPYFDLKLEAITWL